MKESILEITHSAAKALHKVGAIDKTTMREYEALCLQPVKALTPKKIQQLRRKSKVSQAIFAKLLNTSTSTVQQWEQGDKNPNGISLKLLHIVKDYGVGILLPPGQ